MSNNKTREVCFPLRNRDEKLFVIAVDDVFLTYYWTYKQSFHSSSWGTRILLCYRWEFLLTHYITSVQRKHQYLISIQKTAIIFELCFSLGFAMKVSSSRELWLNQVHFNHPNLLEFAYMGSNQQWEHIRIVNEVLKCSLVEHWEIKLQSSLCSCIGVAIWTFSALPVASRYPGGVFCSQGSEFLPFFLGAFMPLKFLTLTVLGWM